MAANLAYARVEWQDRYSHVVIRRVFTTYSREHDCGAHHHPLRDNLDRIFHAEGNLAAVRGDALMAQRDAEISVQTFEN